MGCGGGTSESGETALPNGCGQLACGAIEDAAPSAAQTGHVRKVAVANWRGTLSQGSHAWGEGARVL